MFGINYFQLYSRLPVPLQNLLCSLAGFRLKYERYNSTFRQARHFLAKSEWWPMGKLAAYQDTQLRIIIKHVYQTVPYYRELMQRMSLTPEDIQSAQDLSLLPILDKHTVREQGERMHSSVIPVSIRKYGQTGGTTGTALKLIYDDKIQQWQWAVWWRHRGRFGIKPSDPFIVFAGRDVVPLTSMEPPIWRYNIPMHQTYVSIHHLSKHNLPALAKYLCGRSVCYYSGYPSALYIVAGYFLECGIRLPHPPKMVFTGAETLLPHQRETIEKAFDSKVSDQYGASEYCANISECEQGSYHVDIEYGLVEFLPIPGMPPSLRKIVSTGFHNFAMPLIRYDTGDLATIKDGKCICGREAPMVEKIDGRIESYILTPDGRQMGRLDFLFKKTKNIIEAQLIQDQLDRVTFRIVKNDKYGKEDEIQLVQTIHSYMGTSFTIDLEYVDAIPRERNGKFRQIKSTLFKKSVSESF